MKRALISVSDKTNVVEFAKKLIECNYEVISTGGTKLLLEENNILTSSIEDYTHFPEMLDGRVKTLNPYIHGGILYKRGNEIHEKTLEQHNIKAIDLVCVNLYPFKENRNNGLEVAIENIDIGGPSMLRSAAKNYKDVLCVVDFKDYDKVIEHIKNNNVAMLNEKLAAKAFRHTASYDALIAEFLNKEFGVKDPESITLTYDLVKELRYGENNHQVAKFYKNEKIKNAITSCTQLHGKELSYNNIRDADAAINCLNEFNTSCVVVVKHMNPCGVGIGDSVDGAYDKAYNADPVSIFGGVVATNGRVELETALKMSKIFLEIIVAPSFSDEALNILCKKKNIRLLKLSNDGVASNLECVSVKGGLLVQQSDDISNYNIDFKTVTKTDVSEKLYEELCFAQSVVKHVKSNAIVITCAGQTVGIGAGQMSRIKSAEIALKQAKGNGYTNDLVLSSDAFFPFDDVVDLAHKYGVVAIIQPGGSINDYMSITKCDELGISMVFTNYRHFKH